MDAMTDGGLTGQQTGRDRLHNHSNTSPITSLEETRKNGSDNIQTLNLLTLSNRDGVTDGQTGVISGYRSGTVKTMDKSGEARHGQVITDPRAITCIQVSW